MITPMEIHNREFKKGFRGYNENEVDDFLDRIVVDYEKVLHENEKLRDKLALNDKEVEHYKSLEKSLQDTLSVAQKTADEVLDSAKKTSKELRDNAVRDTQSIYDNTMRETQNIREQAQLESKRLLDDAAHKLRIIVAEYDKIVREKNSFLLKIRAALESELVVTNQLLSATPHTEELAELKSVLNKIETENKIDLPKSAKKVDKSAEKKTPPKVEKLPEPVEPEEEVIEKVSQIVSKAEPLDKTIEIKQPKVAKTFSTARVYSEEQNAEDDLEKTMTFTPIKKPAE